MVRSSVMFAKVIVRTSVFKWGVYLDVIDGVISAESKLLMYCRVRNAENEAKVLFLSERLDELKTRCDLFENGSITGDALALSIKDDVLILAKGIETFDNNDVHIALMCLKLMNRLVSHQLEALRDSANSLAVLLSEAESNPTFCRDLIIWALWSAKNFEEALGDLKEQYADDERIFSTAVASRWYTWQTIKLSFEGLKRPLAPICLLIKSIFWLKKHHR